MHPTKHPQLVTCVEVSSIFPFLLNFNSEEPAVNNSQTWPVEDPGTFFLDEKAVIFSHLAALLFAALLLVALLHQMALSVKPVL